MLEGGYQIGGEFTSAFAKSVEAHVNSLISATNSQRKYNNELNEKEKETEFKVFDLALLCLLLFLDCRSLFHFFLVF
jgi:hypothetical protein